MFRIDRRFVRISGSRAVHTRQSGMDEPPDEQTDAADGTDETQSDELDIDLDGVFDPGIGLGFGTGFEDRFDDLLAEETLADPGFDDDDDPDINEEPPAARDNDTEDNQNTAASAEDLAKLFMTAAEEELEARTEEVMREAHGKAAAIKEQAEKEAESIREQAKQEAEQLKKSAREEGFAEGKKEGLAEGERECKRNYDEALSKKMAEEDEMVNHIIDEVAKQIEHLEADKEEVAIALAIEIVRKIFNPAQEELDTVFISLIKNAIRQMSSDNKFTIRVSAAEYERFFSSGAATIELDSGVTVSASVIRDVELNGGDLIIDTEDVTVNAGVDSQLQYVALAFERANQFEPEVEIV